MAWSSNPCLSIARTISSESSPGSMQIARLVFAQPTMRVCCWKAVSVICSIIISEEVLCALYCCEKTCSSKAVFGTGIKVQSSKFRVQSSTHKVQSTKHKAHRRSIIPHRNFCIFVMPLSSTAASLAEVLDQMTTAGAPELTEQLAAGALKCYACGHRCLIKPGKRGICK